MHTITVRRHTRRRDALACRYTLAFSRLPDRTLGPHDFRNARDELIVGAGLSPAAARGLLFDAYLHDEATLEIAGLRARQET